MLQDSFPMALTAFRVFEAALPMYHHNGPPDGSKRAQSDLPHLGGRESPEGKEVPTARKVTKGKGQKGLCTQLYLPYFSAAVRISPSSLPPPHHKLSGPDN